MSAWKYDTFHADPPPCTFQASIPAGFNCYGLSLIFCSRGGGSMCIPVRTLFWQNQYYKYNFQNSRYQEIMKYNSWEPNLNQTRNLKFREHTPAVFRSINKVPWCGKFCSIQIKSTPQILWWTKKLTLQLNSTFIMMRIYSIYHTGTRIQLRAKEAKCLNLTEDSNTRVSFAYSPRPYS